MTEALIFIAVSAVFLAGALWLQRQPRLPRG